MISNYNLDCGYHNFELKDKIYLVPDYAIKVIYTDGYNEVVFQGDSSNVTLLEGHEITFQEETSFDERFKFSKTLSIKVNGYKTFNDLNYRYYAIIETKDSEFYLVNVDFPSFVTHTYTLNASTNETELVFSSQSNIATLKLTNFEPNNVNTCNEYSTPKVKKFKLTESWASSLSTWQKSLVNKGTFSDIEPLQDSISLTEEFDGEKYTVTLGFDIPMSHFKNDWHLKLLQFTENKYRGYIQLEGGTLVFVGYNVGLFPSYSINGDIISIRLQEVAIRGIAYGNDYAIIDTDMPNPIEFSGATCKNYNFESTCNWEVESKPEYITIEPMSGKAGSNYVLEICNTDDETGYAVSEFVIRSCNAALKTEVVIKNPIYRYIATTDTLCVNCTKSERWVDYGLICENYHKYHLSVKQELDPCSGNTWVDVESATTLVERKSFDCGYDPKHDYLTLYFLDDNDYNGYLTITHPFRTTDTVYYKREGSDTWSEYVIKAAVQDDFGNWYTPNPNKILVDKGDAISFKKVASGGLTLNFSVRNSNYERVYANIEGNPYSLYIGDDVLTDYSASGYAFGGWFENTNIKSAEKMYMRDGNFVNCFANSTIETAPPVVIGRIERAFSGCTDLITAPREITITPAGNWSNSGMSDYAFSDCTSLTTGPEVITILPFNTCKYMFNGCTSLTSSPVISANTLAELACANMFEGCTSLVTANSISATTLGNNACAYMFKGCSSLTTADAISAETLGNYACYYMFSGCTSLATAPELPASGLGEYCYSCMFSDCTSLTTVNVLPATSFTSTYCYNNMFSGCTSLTTVPSNMLPATTLRTGCYSSMFRGCTSLVNAPELPADNGPYLMPSFCYSNMFRDCTSLTTIPDLPAKVVGQSSYNCMFINCTGLTTAPEISATSIDYGGCTGMFSGCTSLTTVPDLHATRLGYHSCDRMFGGCTSLIIAPKLAAISLGQGCCNSMFSGCTSLTTVPLLPATSAANDSYAYSNMFYGCSSLNNITCLLFKYFNHTVTSNWVSGVAASGTFYKNPNLTNWSTGVSYIPTGWDVVDYTE